MKHPLLNPFVWPLVLQPSLSLAYWRQACSVSQTARIDLILNPGNVSGHVHKFAGGSSESTFLSGRSLANSPDVNENSDFNSLQSSNCSSCEVQADKSAYWTPQLYYAHTNGTFEEVPNYGMTVYYVGRGGNSSNTVPFPPGFKMLTGDSLLRSYDNTTLTYLDTRPVADRVSFRCINDANDIPEEHYMFRTDCTNGMRAQVNFQSCWDGVNLYLEDNAHVAYLSGIDYGECPPTHPVPIPGLFFEVLYWTNSVDQTAGGQFVFSNGDTTGYGFHGDFLNGWDMDVQTSAVQDCLYTDDGGVIDACSSLSRSDNINFPRDCVEQASVFDESVHGLLTALPGCNPITSGPDPAPQVICGFDSEVLAVLEPTSSLTAAATSSTSTSSTDTLALQSDLLTSTTSTTGSISVVTVTVFDQVSAVTNVDAPTATDLSSVDSTMASELAGSIVTEWITVTVTSPGNVVTSAAGVVTSAAGVVTSAAGVVTSAAGLVSTTTVSSLGQETLNQDTTSTTIPVASLDSSNTSDTSVTPATLDASASFFCSLYSDFTIEGCPPPTSTASSPTAAVQTALVTVTQLDGTATDPSTEATSTESSSTGTELANSAAASPTESSSTATELANSAAASSTESTSSTATELANSAAASSTESAAASSTESTSSTATELANSAAASSTESAAASSTESTSSTATELANSAAVSSTGTTLTGSSATAAQTAFVTVTQLANSAVNSSSETTSGLLSLTAVGTSSATATQLANSAITSSSETTSTGSAATAVGTAFVTVTQLANSATNSSSETTSTESSAMAATTVLRIRGREVVLTSR
ncbi:hypothetical protein CLCR_09595 [Cladophialophora carrionii]|uniref:DUF1996 domain-containing protein n=1 Tax=Cladophialophora carrionii TaxID=86049 RepID=A0A1C1CYR7_9EURO|nr:hypothetical protein CLCR_09595 [Cladophialophora carrionii]